MEWGISYSEIIAAFESLGYCSTIEGEDYKVYPVDEIITDSEPETTYEYRDINIILACWPDSLSVAGYNVESIDLHFAHIPEDGILTHKNDNTAMYAAQYIFTPSNIDIVADGLQSKLESIYGTVDRSGKSNGLFGINKWFVWEGANNTGVSLNVQDNTEEKKIIISYFTYEGDEWLSVASKAEKERILHDESDAAQNTDVSGL